MFLSFSLTSLFFQVSNSQPSQIIYEKESNIVIDYSGLDEDLSSLDETEDVKKVEKSLEKQINELQTTINKIQVEKLIFWYFQHRTNKAKCNNF